VGIDSFAPSRTEGSWSTDRGRVTAMTAERPVVLFACVHNSGRSVAAKVLTEHLAAGRVEVRSAGSDPGAEVNPGVAAVLAERGLDTGRHEPALLTLDGVREADVVVTTGCGEECPYVPGKHYEDGAVKDPQGEDLATVREIVDDVDARVRDLLARIGVADRPR
jgi:arsenate reductase (thioredoxin)